MHYPPDQEMPREEVMSLHNQSLNAFYKVIERTTVKINTDFIFNLVKYLKN